MTRVLALDLATVAGIFFKDNDGNPVRRTVDLAQLAGVPDYLCARRHGDLLLACEALLFDLVTQASPTVIAVENDTGRNKKTAAYLAGLRGVVHMTAARRGIRVIDDMKASDARKLAGVPGGGSKKEEAVAAARLYFRIPASATDDEVDAEILHRATVTKLFNEELAARAKFIRKRKPKPASYVDRLLAPTISRSAR